MVPNHTPHTLLPRIKRRYAIALCLHIAVLFSSSLYAADQDSAPDQNNKEPTPEPSILMISPLDSSRDVVAKKVIDFANWLDNFFGDERIYDESQTSHLKLNLLYITEDDNKPRYKINLQGKLNLPHTQKRLKLLLESDPPEDAAASTTVADAVESQEQSLGLRYIQYSSDWLLAHTDAGVRFRSGLDTFVRFRLRGLFTLGNWNLRAAETVYWRDSTGLGETTQLDIERGFFSKELLFRSTSKAAWLREEHQFDMGQNFYLIHTINPHRAVIYRAGLSAVSEPQNHITSYILSVRLRQQLHRDWLFFEINPKILYPEEEDFHPQRSLTLKLEVIFGGIKRK